MRSSACGWLIRGISLISRQQIAVRIDQVVDKVPDLVWRQFRRCMRIEQSGLVDALAVSCESRLDRQLLNRNAQVHDGGKLRGDPTDPDRLNSVSVDMARHFHDAFIGQILDQAVVWHIAVYQRRVAGYRGMNDA